MSNVRSLKYNVVMNTILNLSNIIFPLITFPYVTRHLSVSGMGLVNYYNSIGVYGCMLASLGIGIYGIRTCAVVRDDRSKLSKIVGELLTIELLSSIFIGIIMLLLTVVIPQLKKNVILFTFQVILVLSNWCNINWFFSAIEEYAYITKRSVTIKFVSFISVLFFVHTEKDFVLYALISMISIIANEMINLIYIRKYVDFHFAFVGLKRHIKPMLLLFSGLLAVSIYTSLDTIMLGIICGEQDVGYYTVAVKTKSILLTLINSISTVLLPRMSYFLENNKQKEYEKILTMSIELIMLISLPITIFFVVNSSETIFLLGGMNYEPSIFCMQIIMPILLISSFSNIIGNQMLIPNGRDCYFTKAVLSGAVVDIILNALFMPRWGYIGAAVATLFAELTQALFQFHYAKDIFTSRLRKYELIKIIFCVIPATLCVCVTSIENKIASILINAIIFVVVYIVFLHLVNQKTYNKIEKNILKGLL